MDRCGGPRVAGNVADFLTIFSPLTSVIRLYRTGTSGNRPLCGRVRKDRKSKGYSITRRKQVGDVVQLVRTLPCHGRGRGFESRRPRHSFQVLAMKEWHL